MVCSPVSFFLMQSGLRLQSVRLQKKLSAGFPCFRSVFAYAIVSREVLLPSRCMRKRVQSVRSARTKGPPPLAPPLWEGNFLECLRDALLNINPHAAAAVQLVNADDYADFTANGLRRREPFLQGVFFPSPFLRDL